ncbi:hypothetical protein M422DRAFT_53304 [Sphaerobolus stellatus SS14]|uniref:Uncharacterized protein n=1 Tax=Sphaerobolus stellatus (strain SS14) TaxID=990650 RepID=A0A0C9V240_SPHS4|nr:hypothetical protein M422DRAFT_53304 [Sphaerobolus stellatus SS14]
MEAEDKRDPSPSNIGHQKEMIGDMGVLAGGGGVHIPPVHSIDDTTLQQSYQTEQSSMSQCDPWPTPPGGDGTAIVYAYDMPSHPDAPIFESASAMQGRPISMSQQPPSGTGTAAQQVPRPPSRTRAPAHSGQLVAAKAVVTLPQSPTAYHSGRDQRIPETDYSVGFAASDALASHSWHSSQYESAAHGAYPPQHGAPSTDQYHGNTTDFTSHSETMFNQYSVYDGSYYQVDDMYTTQYNNQGNAGEVGQIVYGEGTNATYGYGGQGTYSEAPHES